MRWVLALLAELFIFLRAQTKLTVFVIVLVWSAWAGIAGPVVEHFGLLEEVLDGLDD